MLSFIAAVYNEQNEISDLVHHVAPYVQGIYIADDGSKDDTVDILRRFISRMVYPPIQVQVLGHSGLPETVKSKALGMVPDGSWVLMLDADERFAPGVLDAITDWLTTEHALFYTHVYFNQIEIVDGQPRRAFQKAKLFKKEAITFPLNNIHADDQFEGHGLYREDWVVLHRKTSEKQAQREKEYLETYDRLLEEGHIDEGRRQWLRGLHYTPPD